MLRRSEGQYSKRVSYFTVSWTVRNKKEGLCLNNKRDIVGILNGGVNAVRCADTFEYYQDFNDNILFDINEVKKSYFLSVI